VPLTRFVVWTFVILLSLKFGVWSFAQPSPPPVTDPLMNLMITQPKIDTTSPVRAVAAFDPPVVRPGEPTIYRVTFNALEESVDWPAEVPAPLEMRPQAGAHGQILQMAGPALVPFTSFNTRVQPSTAGQFVVPQFVVQVYGRPVTVPAAQLEVVSARSGPTTPAGRLLLAAATTNVFVGQGVVVRVLLLGPPGALAQVQLNGEGFIVDPGAASTHTERITSEGMGAQAYVYQTMLTPVKAGKLSVSAQAFTAGLHFTGPISGPVALQAGPAQYTLLESDPITLSARPLPREGALPGFTGAIGRLGLGPVTLASNTLRVGEPVSLTVTITNRGETNLARLSPPEAPRVRDWQVLEAVSDGAPPQLVLARGFATFSYTLIPQSEETRATPPIPFSCFDPGQDAYVDLTIPSFPVTVKPGAEAADLATLQQVGRISSDPEKDPALSGLAASPGRTAQSLVPLQGQTWFPLVQLAPAAAFLGLWGWDRRRRFLEQHQDIVLRRRARRALRREKRALRRAARTGDAQGFAAAAVSAMRVACAPHYPAEPRALVCGDVLQVLHVTSAQKISDNGSKEGWGEELAARSQESERDQSLLTSAPTMDLVRRFFAVTDASSFATAAPDPGGLLVLQPEVERVLEQLEAKL